MTFRKAVQQLKYFNPGIDTSHVSSKHVVEGAQFYRVVNGQLVSFDPSEIVPE